HREAQTYLFGRVHIDMRNLTQIYASGLPGIFEQSRITGMPLQEGSRRSPGAGFSAMQTIAALREDVLVPYRKAQAERPKSARKLIQADQGGLIGQPLIGVHYGVREFDFISMYPSIITTFNLSPETIFKDGEETATVPHLGYRVSLDQQGLIPKALYPLVTKRIKLKKMIATTDRRDCRYERLKQQNNAQKSLQTTAFGYMGHKHFKFTQIEVHESITAYSREAMFVTKEILEEAGYAVVHLYVDGIYFKQKGKTMLDGERDRLLEQISTATGLPMGDEGLYKWIIFLPSRQDRFASVPNRFFGVFANGEIKVRGIEARTRDTPPFIKAAQMKVIEIMAAVPLGERLEPCLPEALRAFRAEVTRLRRREIDPADLVVTQVLSRDIDAYQVESRVVRATRQLEAAGKTVSKGMRMRYVMTRDPVGVVAWDAGVEIRPEMIDMDRYLDLLIRAGDTVFQSFEIEKEDLRNYVLGNGVQLPLPYRYDQVKAWPLLVEKHNGQD
ncbi:MAG: DNA polymerase domain-containing protein, partial [Chloroflexota bacterium]